MSDLTLEDFKKTQLRAAKILDAQEIPGADRIWRLELDLGSEKKTVVAGIKKFYAREELLGKSVVVVDNLVPTVIRGVESKGMLLAAKDGDRLTLLTTDKEVPPGSPIG
jgi:methionyl-tRNA synthetase